MSVFGRSDGVCVPCGVCGVKDIPARAAWSYFIGNKRVHPSCLFRTALPTQDMPDGKSFVLVDNDDRPPDKQLINRKYGAFGIPLNLRG